MSLQRIDFAADMEAKPLPMGLFSFTGLINRNCAYVDKTNFLVHYLD